MGYPKLGCDVWRGLVAMCGMLIWGVAWHGIFVCVGTGKAVIVTALTSSQASDSVVLAGRKVLAVFPDMQIGDDGLTDKVDWCVACTLPHHPMIVCHGHLPATVHAPPPFMDVP